VAAVPGGKAVETSSGIFVQISPIVCTFDDYQVEWQVLAENIKPVIRLIYDFDIP
jgi:hypothetical protein